MDKLQPKAVRMKEAEHFSGLSGSTLRRLGRRGEVTFIKVGRSKLVEFNSLKALLDRGVVNVKAA